MNFKKDFELPSLSISAVERDTGLSKDTLRVWEKRYGFPRPNRDELGERTYPQDQVEKLRVIKRLLDAGHRPGKVVNLDIEALQNLSEVASSGSLVRIHAAGLEELEKVLDLIRGGETDAFKREMARLLLSKGLKRFVTDVVAPMNVMVGDAWARGQIEIYEEHLYTECIQVMLRNALSSVAGSVKRPEVIITTLPSESHGLGLLMVECMLAIEGASPVSLGTQTPIYDLALVCKKRAVDVVALSFSSVNSAPSVLESIAELRGLLPKHVELWCGGASSILRKRKAQDFILVDSLENIGREVSRWRASHTKHG